MDEAARIPCIPSAFKRAIAIVLPAFALCVIVVATVDWGFRMVQEGWALATVKIFADLGQKAECGSAGNAAACLRYVVEYYPSGTRIQQGSRLDQMVEVARQEAIHRITRVLREKTGIDRGDNPAAWWQTPLSAP